MSMFLVLVIITVASGFTAAVLWKGFLFAFTLTFIVGIVLIIGSIVYGYLTIDGRKKKEE